MPSNVLNIFDYGIKYNRRDYDLDNEVCKIIDIRDRITKKSKDKDSWVTLGNIAAKLANEARLAEVIPENKGGMITFCYGTEEEDF